ncbi:hypothetical protein PSTG_10678 [Puccinia striiformis f. sp. tritici PST-78]|uniref:Uncharacterized protein n=1 Tax=Puccinia striiformis f. sp. tritici PST-78 TaxID=1165861 RepID=A0A0L0V9N1_9BASI|nr:hypothetical protein PSTG_10678 [Puccinia striiformis f. sp. tritici PST-78]
MDFDSGNPAGNIGCAPGMWELEILPAISSAGNHDPDEDIHPTHPADPPGRSIVYNRTILRKNCQQVLADSSSDFYRRTIHWKEGLCIELIQFFGAWYQRHTDLTNKSSVFLMRATYASNYEDVLQAYPLLNGYL